MSSSQPGHAPGSTGPLQPRLQRPLVFFDLEAVAVVAILIGLFQVLMALPLYYLGMSVPFYLPLCVGAMFVAAGSFAVACEKAPSKELLKGCAVTNVAGLVGALCALCVYSVCIHSPPNFSPCIRTTHYYIYEDYNSACPGELLSGFFQMLTILLLIYDIVALILHSILSFSALKGLKSN